MMSEPAKNLCEISPELDIGFVNKVVSRKKTKVRLVHPIKKRNVDAIFIGEDTELTIEDLQKLFEIKDQLIDLEKPIYQCIQISNPVTFDLIEAQFKRVVNISRNKGLCDFGGVEEVSKEIISEILRSEVSSPLRLSSLTMLSDQEKLFRNSLFSAMLGVKLSVQLGLDSDLENVFYAGLFQDVGKLFLDKITPFNSNLKDNHPLISANVLNSAGFPQEVIDAVNLHEFYLNGYGYPKSQRLPNYLAQTIQVANQFMANINLERGLEFTLGTLNSHLNSSLNDGKKPSLDVDIVKALISLYPEINQERFRFYADFQYYKESFRMMEKKIRTEVKLNLARIQSSPEFGNLDSDLRKQIQDCYKVAEDCGNCLNSNLTLWGENGEGIKMDSFRFSRKDILYVKIHELISLSSSLTSRSYGIFGHLLESGKFLHLKYDEMIRSS